MWFPLKTRVVLVCLASLSVSVLGCEESEAPEAVDPVAPVPTPPPAPAPATPAAAEPEEPARPLDVDTELNEERRKAIEDKYEDAKGFVVAAEIESDLKENEAVTAKEAAVAAFDQRAKGKWVLFAGPMVNLTEEGFELGVTYTPKAANDPMGMSRQFFTVSLKDIEGYDEEDFKAGDKVVVLAKYTGDKTATPGYELVDAGVWKQ